MTTMNCNHRPRSNPLGLLELEGAELADPDTVWPDSDLEQDEGFDQDNSWPNLDLGSLAAQAVKHSRPRLLRWFVFLLTLMLAVCWSTPAVGREIVLTIRIEVAALRAAPYSKIDPPAGPRLVMAHACACRTARNLGHHHASTRSHHHARSCCGKCVAQLGRHR
jgi:hypothetical protein